MGTPDFAVPTLKALFEAGHEIAGVFTQPDKPVGRKQILTPPPVKTQALIFGLSVFQPATLRDGSVCDLIKKLNPDVIVVVAYGKILPEEILNIPPYGCVNGHASLLPRHRGASPIQWAIVCGDQQTGVTTMLMEKGLDTGDMLLKASVTIGANETAGQLHDRLSVLGADLMLKTLDGLKDGSITPIKQDDALSTYAPILKKEMGLLDFSKTADELHNLIRGFNPWPAAYFMLNGKRIKVYASSLAGQSSDVPGRVIGTDGELVVACGQQTALRLLEIQPEGSKKMSAADYVRGHGLKTGFLLKGE